MAAAKALLMAVGKVVVWADERAATTGSEMAVARAARTAVLKVDWLDMTSQLACE